jgi:hypothetical protein
VTGRRLLAVLALSLGAVLAIPASAEAQIPTPPHPTCSPGPADCRSWHNAAVVTVTWAPTPPGVIAESCDPETITGDTAGTAVSCTWWSSDLTEYHTTGVLAKRDATPPSIDVKPSRGPDHNGWYNRSVTIDFSGGDNLSGLAGCTAARPYAGPDSGVASATGTCTDKAGNVRSGSFSFQYDGTAPTATANPDRKPDRKGWYNHRLKVEFKGSDATSGVGSCAPDVTYDGPDSSKTAVAGTCTDRAANTSSPAALELRFDSRPPVLARLKAEPREKSVALRWVASGDASSFTVLRRPGLHGARFSTVYSGPKDAFVDGRVAEGVRYRYSVTAYDEAGNDAARGLRVRALADGTAKASVRTTVTPALRRPLNGARLSAPPLLAWSAVPKATYYNVQLFRAGKKVFTAWPTGESLRLARAWRFDGRVQRLSPGRYRWFVWPGFGERTASRYGKLVGTRTFVVTRG